MSNEMENIKVKLEDLHHSVDIKEDGPILDYQQDSNEDRHRVEMSSTTIFLPVEEELLIEEIRNFPVIYSSVHPKHKDIIYKDAIWKSISEKVGKSVDECKKKWKTLRDSFNRGKKKMGTGSAASTKRKWPLAAHLSFLNDVPTERKTSSKVISLQEEENEVHELENVENETNCASAESSSAESFKKKRKTNSNKLYNLLEKRSAERKEVISSLIGQNEKIIKEDDIDLFCRSIALSMKKLPPRGISEAKIEKTSRRHSNSYVQIKTEEDQMEVDLQDLHHSIDIKEEILIKQDFRIPLPIHTRKKLFKCYTCGYKSSHAGHFNRHLRTHPDESPYKCNLCDFKCSHKVNLKHHLLTHHGGKKPYECSICNYKSSQTGHFNRHLRTHTGEKPYKCHICDFKSSQRVNLKHHLLTHAGKKPYECNICDFKCSRQGYLKRHLLIHTGEKPYECNICSYKCSQKARLKDHFLIHKGEKPYKCNNCDYKCSTKRSLKSHILTHMGEKQFHKGEKPYECNICDYKFAHKSSLKRHVLIHTGEKPFKCNICVYTCLQKGHLKRHLLTHTGEKPYECNFCDYKCSLKRYLKTHLLKHTVEDPRM